jgi:hypothetical protein
MSIRLAKNKKSNRFSNNVRERLMICEGKTNLTHTKGNIDMLTLKYTERNT